MCLVGVASVGSVATSGFASAASSGVGSAAGWRVGYLSKSFVGNNLLLKLLRTFCFALNNNPKLFKNTFFLSVLVLFLKFFYSTAKL